MNNIIITLDGPVASGKSSLARALAQRLGYYHINSGFLYRALAYVLLHHCNKTIASLYNLTEQDLRCIHKEQLKYGYTSEPCITYQQEDITSLLKTRDIDDASSIISMFPFIRLVVNQWQHQLAKNHNIVIDGRDIGSVVFPNASIKFYVTASPEIRAQRWQRDQVKKGNHFTIEESLAEIKERDRRDSTRSIAPMIIPENAFVLDNSDLTLQQSIDLALEYVK